MILPKISYGLNYNQISKMNLIVENDESIINPSEMQKISLPISNIIYILKEIVDFINEKTEYGVSIYMLRRMHLELVKIKKEKRKISENIK